MKNIDKAVQAQLFELQDLKYKEFQAKLMPTVDPALIIGVRTPSLRAYGKALFGTEAGEAFLKVLPHKYYEENNLHAVLIEQFKDFDRAMGETERFLPYIDNWATCDMFAPKVFKKHPDLVYEKAKKWMKDTRTYTIRYGIGVLLSNFLDEEFRAEHLGLVSSIDSNEYYVNMMIAWYFSTALAKQYDITLPYIEEMRLEKWVHNKAIQKALESYRIDGDRKAYLRTLKKT